jgi:hypothetical protein
METAYREPNGRPSRSSEPPDAVALEARARHIGLTLIKAKDQRAATFIGYLNILGPIDGLSDRQYDAAIKYLDLRDAYLQTLKAPNAEVDNEGGGMPNEFVSPAYEDWCQDTRETWDECRKAIQETQNENRSENLWAALDLCIIHSHRVHHLIGATRLVCNCLVKFFRC